MPKALEVLENLQKSLQNEAEKSSECKAELKNLNESLQTELQKMQNTIRADMERISKRDMWIEAFLILIIGIMLGIWTDTEMMERNNYILPKKQWFYQQNENYEYFIKEKKKG